MSLESWSWIASIGSFVLAIIALFISNQNSKVITNLKTEITKTENRIQKVESSMMAMGSNNSQNHQSAVGNGNTIGNTRGKV